MAALPAIPDRWPFDPAEFYDAAEFVRELLRRPWWHELAACRGQEQAPFFGTPSAQAAAVETWCSSCPVVVECAQAAAETVPAPVGVWGGRTDRDRARRAV